MRNQSNMIGVLSVMRFHEKAAPVGTAIAETLEATLVLFAASR
jgi:hypothetical protein